MNEYQREELIRDVEKISGHRSRLLNELNISRTTYYRWRRAYDESGLEGVVKRKPMAKRIWNKLLPEEEDKIVEVAKLHPELSPRLLAVKITDQEDFSVSEAAVYRVLKERNLIEPRPLSEMPAAKSWRHKTTRPDEIWQCDATNLFITGWGYYKLIPVEDDYSRKIITWDIRPDETAFSFSDIVEMGLEQAGKQGHLLENKPTLSLYTDNGPGFTSRVMADYLACYGIRHILGTPYHPQGRGKIERFNRTIKGKLCLVVYCSPEELKKATAEAISVYNATPHESLQNVSPEDVYAGRKEEILEKRREKKRLTLARRKQYNLSRRITQKNNPDRRQSVT